MVPTAENNVLTMDSPVDETAIPLPAEIENKTTKEKTTFNQNADIKTQTVKEDFAVAKEAPASVPVNIHSTESQAIPANVVTTEEKKNIDNQPHQAIRTNEPSSSKRIEEEVFPVEETSKDDFIENEAEETEIRQPIFSIPNIFTPNGDNINDFFVIEQIPDIELSHLYIYNLSGRVLYEKMNYKNDWNGNHLPDGVYLYIYKFVYKGNEFIRKGTLTIKRR
jgi:gliding motility-associated-like protein